MSMCVGDLEFRSLGVVSDLDKRGRDKKNSKVHGLFLEKEADFIELRAHI